MKIMGCKKVIFISTTVHPNMEVLVSYILSYSWTIVGTFPFELEQNNREQLCRIMEAIGN